MDLNEYQQLALRTMSDTRRDPEQSLINGALGLTGEAGEVADIVKKHVFHGHDIDEQELKKELGDVLWYIACCATALDMNLNDIGMFNIEKLKRRYPNGFTKEDSLNRKD
ncbi:nucleoside triphosphate pyrophosphohydrolase family protein [Mammaliicoccus vitulinus]|uniref:nucleoside triphosphate pyrophosphohydrolase family protein n=1 Tax=Mammaliicoccus vitulinus TaxID=71237 RepID=UPI003B9E72E1